MATTNGNNALVRYETELGEVKLSPQIIKQYLVSGDAEKVTEQEVMMFLALCRYQRLNPFLREAYLIKFGNSPATIVTGKETFTKRAAASEKVTGWEAGVIIQKEDGSLDYRVGTIVLPEEKLVGGWAKVHRKDWTVPLETSVSLAEYERKKKDGTLMSNWRNMPATMIRKVALVQALREAMPSEFAGMYSPEEMPVDDSTLDSQPINVTPEPTVKTFEKLHVVDNDELQRRADAIVRVKQLVDDLQIPAEQMREMIADFFPGKTNSKELTVEEWEQLAERLESTAEIGDITETDDDDIAADVEAVSLDQ